MISIDKAVMTVDESMRRLGMSEINLFVAIADNTEFHQRDWDPFQRYAYKASLYGFGRHGSPSRSSARHLATFGLVVNERQLICTPFPRFNCRFVTRARTSERLYFRSQGGGSDNRVVMLGQESVVVSVDQLDVDPASQGLTLRLQGNEVTIPSPNADSIFCKIEVLDLDNNDAVVARGESNTITDFYGRTEKRAGIGDDRRVPA